MANYEGYKMHLIEKIPEKKIIIVTLNRPEMRNPVDNEMHAELASIYEEIEYDDEVNAVVLTGAGKGFCSGANVGHFNRMITGETERKRFRGGGFGGFGAIDCSIPVIAAVNGDAVGAGSNLALQCDVVFMAEDARIGDLHVRMGIVAGDGGVLWPILVGINKAKELILTGDLITGKEAERIGLVNHALPREEVLPAAIAFAERLAKGAIQAISWNKRVMNKLWHQYMMLMIGEAGALEAHCFQRSADHREAVQAFMEKRQPNFPGEWLGMM